MSTFFDNLYMFWALCKHPLHDLSSHGWRQPCLKQGSKGTFKLIHTCISAAKIDP